MICKWCASSADRGMAGSLHTVFKSGKVSCRSGTHCDCQHKEPGTAVSEEVSDLAKRINEGLSIV